MKISNRVLTELQDFVFSHKMSEVVKIKRLIDK